MNSKVEIPRVLQVFSRMDRGGAESMIMNYYRKIDKTKLQFDFLVHTNERCAFDEEIELLGGRIYHLPKYSIKNHFDYKNKIRTFLYSHPEHKIIHGHYFTISAIYLKIAKKMDRICIAHSHTALNEVSVKHLIFKLLIAPLRYLADYKLACSKLAGKWMFGSNNNKVIILKNAIDVNKFVFDKIVRNNLRKEFKIEDKFVVGHIGRFFHPKNHNFLIQIFQKITLINDDAVLLLVGDGELREQIENKVQKLGLKDKVIFTGVRTDIPELLQAMDVFLLPSFYEGLPVTLVEAQAAGLKVFASDTITTEIAITDNITFLSLQKSTEFWAEKINNANVGYERKGIKKEIIDAGYDVEDSAKWLENFYLSIMSK
jgi:glycosyltransferase involved in cell wall biosynthesis